MVDQQTVKPHLYYWNCRGLGAFINLAFGAAGQDYDYTIYSMDREEDWKRDKLTHTNTLPNLPCLVDGSVIVTEHDAIFRHVLRKYKPELLGKTIDEQAEVDMFITFWMKTNGLIRDFCYSVKDPSDEAKRAEVTAIDYELSRINERLATREWLVGDSLTGADLYMYETFRALQLVHAEAANQYANVKRVADAIEETEWFKAYRGSSKWENQFNGDEAFTNNKH